MANFLYTIIIYPLVQIIELCFALFNDVFKNTGVAVIGVSFAVSMLCLPLYIVAERWQQLQRETEKKLEPGIARIKSVFKNDEQYMILSEFYRQNHYHPIMALRSSFGLLIQIPFFIAAYRFLSDLSVLKGAQFLFIRDMGSPDALFSVGTFPLNVLPAAMTAVNIIAGAVYTKGFKAKDKIQIYGMALIFLVILYNSPAGLVLYWTMNNVFSLVKNIFYKIKHPAKVLYCLFAAAVLALDGYLLFVHNGFLHKRLLMAGVCTVLLAAPLAVKGASRLLDTVLQPLAENKQLRFSLFFTSAAALCLLAGFVIPSYVINSSAVEFCGIDGYGSPLAFLGQSLLQVFGLTVFWTSCIYFLFGNRIQTGIAVLMTCVLFASLVNAFLFSGDYGNLSRLITFSNSISAAKTSELLLNAACVLLAAALPFIFFRLKKTKIPAMIVSIVLIAEAAVSAVHTAQIQGVYKKYSQEAASNLAAQASVEPLYHFSKTGKNVAVFMFDRAENSYIMPIFEAFPELYGIYEGFTLYRNTVSYNQGTLLGAPPLFGGYEYTPAEINKRSTERLVDKHNEALLLMPRIFTENADFNAEVSDWSWANYSWIPDMSICDPYPKISGFNVQRRYSGLYLKENPDKVKPFITSTSIKRNLSWFSLFKMAPLFMRDSIYDDGSWWSSDEQTTDIMEFIDYYSALSMLPRLTDFSAQSNMFFSIVNDTTHSGAQLAPPKYEPASGVPDSDGKPLKFKSVDGNIAMLMRLGEWIEYLKANDCYDNTRIIIVSDHGIGTKEGMEIDFPEDWPMPYNPDHNHPLLMVKDFNARGTFAASDDFMTNADVPALAFAGIIEHPVNPFTGKEIRAVTPAQKKAAGVVLTHNWRPGGNGLNTFKVPQQDWYTIEKNIFEAANWQQGVLE
ncbi:MAG: membrane protein insertase YidC [Bacteroides sp.]|nr:membrane protein insertase YidC [Prevotella sp.]MCM1407852.1 membrane protein insertase YidC [Treponema brennaborense]MCM1469594.1 membrane protein insertase YidC [Bacteroides sp.]